MKTIEFDTPFATEFQTTIRVRNKYGTRDEIPFVFPCIKKKEHRICQVCSEPHPDELHILPSGIEHWIGCPKCKMKIEKERGAQLVREHMDTHKMKFDITAKRSYGKGIGEWVRKDGYNPETSTSNKQNKISRGF